MAFTHRTSTATPLRPGPSGRPRDQVTQIQRDRILAATGRVVAEVGFGCTTVAKIIGRARVSRKTFYGVFADREDCFLAVFDRAVARASQAAGEAYAGERDWRTGMRAGLTRLLVLAEAEPDTARLCVVEALAGGPRLLRRRAEVLAAIADVVDRGRACGDAAIEPAPLTAAALVEGAFGLLHARLLDGTQPPLIELRGPLMSLIVLPYLGPREANEELRRPVVRVRSEGPPADHDARRGSLDGLSMRLTYRTARVLSAIADRPGSSNREVAHSAGVADQGQISKLLTRLARHALIANRGDGQEKGARNAWHLTERGAEIERAARLR
jgi:AcrR family transcriptional regulator